MSELTHIDEQGRAKMVDTTEKSVSERRAIASARVLMSAETISAIRNHTTPKGNPLETARLAGIMAAKRTHDLIPLCHPLPLTHIDLRAELQEAAVYLESEVRTRAQTGVEMEALTAVSVAAFTVFAYCT